MNADAVMNEVFWSQSFAVVCVFNLIFFLFLDWSHIIYTTTAWTFYFERILHAFIEPSAE